MFGKTEKNTFDDQVVSLIASTLARHNVANKDTLAREITDELVINNLCGDINKINADIGTMLASVRAKQIRDQKRFVDVFAIQDNEGTIRSSVFDSFDKAQQALNDDYAWMGDDAAIVTFKKDTLIQPVHVARITSDND